MATLVRRTWPHWLRFQKFHLHSSHQRWTASGEHHHTHYIHIFNTHFFLIICASIGLWRRYQARNGHMMILLLTQRKLVCVRAWSVCIWKLAHSASQFQLQFVPNQTFALAQVDIEYDSKRRACLRCIIFACLSYAKRTHSNSTIYGEFHTKSVNKILDTLNIYIFL